MRRSSMVKKTTMMTLRTRTFSQLVACVVKAWLGPNDVVVFHPLLIMLDLATRHCCNTWLCGHLCKLFKFGCMDVVIWLPVRLYCSRHTDHGIVNECITGVSDKWSGAPTHWSNNPLNSGVRKAFLPRCILLLQLDQIKKGRWGKDSLHHTVRCVLLSGHAFRPEKRRSNLSVDDAKLPRKSIRTQYPSLHRWCGHHHEEGRVFDQRPGGNFRQPK
jgi:hypothetical protein